VRKVMTLLLVLSLAAAAACGDDEPSSSRSSTTTGPQRSVLEAVEVWVVEHRDTVFPGFDGEFAGACDEGVLNVLCTIPREDLGIRTIVGVGAASSDWGADLLLQRGDEGWTAVDFWAWDLESDALGPPFSALTAIAEWWSTIDPNAVFVRNCDDINAPTAQELVCAVLESDGDEVRQYRTGRPPTIDAHQVEVHHQPDHSWVVAG
jgi:hypothetical protein